MFTPTFVLLAIALSSSAVDAFVTVGLNKVQGRNGSYMKGAPAAARARVAIQKGKSAAGVTSAPATNLDYVQYTSSIGVGSPATDYDLVIDTGSSNTFVGTGKKYVRTSTSVSTGQAVNVTYGSGFFSGEEYLDTVTIAPGLVISNQSIGDATRSEDFEGVDGVIGVGPVALTQGTLSRSPNTLIPTVTDNALTQGLISTEVIGVFFAPANTEDDTNGEITFGGIDSSKFTGSLEYTSLTTTQPASFYWGIDITKATYGSNTIISSSHAGIVDTGTTQVLLADDFFSKYTAAIPGASVDDDTGLLVIPQSSVSGLQSLVFTIGGNTFTLTAEAQLIPQSENEVWGGVSGKQYGYLGSLGSDSGEGLDFILGQKFLERYYSVFDTTEGRVGFAETSNTFASF